MSTLNVTNIKAADGTTGMTVANSTGVVTFNTQPVNAGGGKILQVTYDQKTNAVTYGTSYTLIMSQNITPSATSSIILVQATIATYHASAGQHAAKLVKNDSLLNYEVGDFYHNVGSGVAGNINIQYLDVANTTSAINYKIYIKAESGSGSHYINKDYNGATNGVTSLVLTEIGA